MPKSSGEGATGGRRGRTLAQVYRRFGEVDAPKISPLYGHIAIALSESDEALRVIEGAPARRRRPTVVLAALHDLALSGQAPDLATAFTTAISVTPTTPTTSTTPTTPVTSAGPAPTRARSLARAEAGLASAGTGTAGAGAGAGPGAGEAAADTRAEVLDVRTGAAGARADAAPGRLVGEVAVEVVGRMGGRFLEVAAGRKVRGDEGGRHAVLYPAVAEVARRVGAGAVGLIDVGRAAGLNLTVDRVGIAYGNGQSLGDPDSAVRVTASVVGAGRVPSLAMPEVAARVVIDVDPVDVTDADDARWLRACVPPDQVERLARLEAELALALAAPPVLVRGDVVEVLREAIASVPDDVLPVVITTWALSGLDLEARLRFLRRLDEAATRRPVAWVSVEGVGVAPGMPTFGDRRASGHSIIGLGVFDHTSVHATAVGRCWLRGEMLAWLADS